MSLHKKSCGNFTVVKGYGDNCRIMLNSNIICMIDKYTYDWQLALGFNDNWDFVNVVGVDDV
jgi:hypothetical protein